MLTLSRDRQEWKRKKKLTNKKVLNAGNRKANHKPTLQLILATINRPEREVKRREEGEREREGNERDRDVTHKHHLHWKQ